MIDAAWLALRAAAYVLTVQAAGVALFALWMLTPPRQTAAAPVRALGRRTAGAALAVVLAQALYEPLHLGGEWDGLADPALLHLAYTGPGAVALWTRLAGLVLLERALARPGQVGAPAAAGAGLTLAAFLLTGHALVSPARLVLLPLLAVHVGVAAFWFGGIAALRTLLPRQGSDLLAAVLERFSAGAVWLVPLLGLAGALLALTLLPGLRALASPYGRLVCLKALLFLTLLALAAHNRLRLVPGLRRGEPRAVRRLYQTCTAEYVLISVVLIATALMSGLFSPSDPPL